MNFKGRSIISLRDFTKEEILYILNTAKKIDDNRKKYANLAKGKIMGSLFFEPSTRTRLSFETAMQRLGGSIVGFADPDASSVKKGESLHDSMKMMEGYVDVIAMRHPHEGAARLASEAIPVPILNGGDGANQHPSQTMLDLYTIMKKKKKLNGLKVAFLGDLKYGRTVHSLAYALSHFNTRMYFVSPDVLRMPDDLLEELSEKRVVYTEHKDLLEIMPHIDVLYVTRVQKERFSDPLEFEKTKTGYNLHKDMLAGMKKDAIILHPLPRVDELNQDIDSMPQAVYFEQAWNGIPTRMALIALTTGLIQ